MAVLSAGRTNNQNSVENCVISYGEVGGYDFIYNCYNRQYKFCNLLSVFTVWEEGNVGKLGYFWRRLTCVIFDPMSLRLAVTSWRYEKPFS
jgi:hypothetical protein